ncbi:RluA family pseudouridine synthase [Clostridium sp. DL1XJH146]
MENRKEEIVYLDEELKRIDLFLVECYEGKSRTYFQKIVNEGSILVNNKKVKSNYKLKINDVLIVKIPEDKELQVESEDIPLNIVYEDKDIVIVNKPQGMVVHPAPGNYSGTVVNALLHHCKDLSGINGVIRPGIVHRIDKDTSGVIVVAKNDKAHISLAEQLKDHSMNREYIALTEGVIKDDYGTVDKPLARNKRDRIKMAIVKDGKRAVTHFQVLERFEKNTLIKCKLETGRTHQIRVHMRYLGFPLVGDPIYGFKNAKYKLNGQLLHAQRLGFLHPSSGEYVEFSTELPDYFDDILGKLRLIRRS